MPAVNGARLRDRRDERDLSNADLAKLVGISDGYLRNILAGVDEPSNRVIYRFARVLDIPVDEIKAGKRTPQGDPSEPPTQPPNTPKAPPPRRDPAGPRRVEEAAAR